MTFSEMLLEAELLYESLNSSEAPGFTQEEWGRLFTIGQRKVVLNILKEGINKNTFNQMALGALVQKDSFFAVDMEYDAHFKNTNGTFAKRLKSTSAFEAKYFWILDEYVTTATGTNIPINRITYDFYRLNLKNPFKKPDEDEGYWLLQYNVGLPTASTDVTQVIITDGTALVGYYIIGVFHPDNYPIVSGIVYPTTSGTQASCLNPSIHYRIVEEAVTLARMSVVDQAGYQLAVTEFNK